MKSGRIFWALFFITVGVLGAVENFFGLHWPWGGILDFWPLVLVLIGLAVVLRDKQYKWIVVGATGMLVGLLLFSTVNHGCDVVHSDWSDDELKSVDQELRQEFDPSITRASFSFDAGAGRFTISDSTNLLIMAEAQSSIGPYKLTTERLDSMTQVVLGLEGDNSIHWRGKIKNQVNMRLHTAPLWDMDFDIGAAKMDLDLSPYKVNHLSIDAGAASIEVTLGDKAELTTIDLETGVSSILFRIPQSVDCEIRSDAPMSSRHFDGFESLGDGEYRTAEFGKKNKRMLINIDAGMSSIRVERY